MMTKSVWLANSVLGYQGYVYHCVMLVSMMHESSTKVVNQGLEEYKHCHNIVKASRTLALIPI